MRETVAEVLAQERYEALQPTLIDRVWAEILSLVGRVLALLEGTGQAGIIGTVVLLVALAGVAYLVIRLLRRVRPGGASDEPDIGLAGRSPRDWAKEADEHEQARRWREAVRCWHRALVAELAEAGLTEEVPGRTAAEYSADVAVSVPAAAASFASATASFERAWYADAAVGPEDVDAVKGAADEVRRAASLRATAVGA